MSLGLERRWKLVQNNNAKTMKTRQKWMTINNLSINLNFMKGIWNRDIADWVLYDVSSFFLFLKRTIGKNIKTMNGEYCDFMQEDGP